MSELDSVVELPGGKSEANVWCPMCGERHPRCSIGNRDCCKKAARVGDFHPDGDCGGVPELKDGS